MVSLPNMIPPGKEAEFFSIYEVSERGTSWLGPLAFGLVNQITGSLRPAIVSNHPLLRRWACSAA